MCSCGSGPAESLSGKFNPKSEKTFQKIHEPTISLPVASLPDASELLDGGTHDVTFLKADKDLMQGNGALSMSGPVASELTQTVQVAAGSGHTCALQEDGTVFCWGSNLYGQLGINSDIPCRGRPTKVDGIVDAVEVVAGGVHTCVRRKTGTVLCFGSNEFGQVGDGAEAHRIFPVLVPGLSGVRELNASLGITCAVGLKSRLYCWGTGTQSILCEKLRDTPKIISKRLGPVKDVAVGDDHICVLKPNGNAGCMGSNLLGQLGGTRNEDSLKLKKVSRVKSGRQIVCGESHCCFLRADGTVACWGSNLLGEIGQEINGSTFRRPVPVRGLRKIKQLSSFSNHTCALSQAGQITCWGANGYGQLGIVSGDEEPPRLVRMPGIKGARYISAGYNHTCAVLKNGSVHCFGENDFGQLGNGRNDYCSGADPLPDSFGAIKGETSRSGSLLILKE